MGESKRFDPLGWLVSTCFTLLASAVAMVIAVDLIESIWAWLVTGIGVAVFIAALVSIGVWWQRRRPW